MVTRLKKNFDLERVTTLSDFKKIFGLENEDVLLSKQDTPLANDNKKLFIELLKKTLEKANRQLKSLT